jgi:hypothetical protein
MVALPVRIDPLMNAKSILVTALAVVASLPAWLQLLPCAAHQGVNFRAWEDPCRSRYCVRQAAAGAAHSPRRAAQRQGVHGG